MHRQPTENSNRILGLSFYYVVLPVALRIFRHVYVDHDECDWLANLAANSISNLMGRGHTSEIVYLAPTKVFRSHERDGNVKRNLSFEE